MLRILGVACTLACFIVAACLTGYPYRLTPLGGFLAGIFPGEGSRGAKITAHEQLRLPCMTTNMTSTLLMQAALATPILPLLLLCWS